MKRVLIVDDSTTTREAFALGLRREGYEVQTARDGVDALEKLQTDELPELIVLDMSMPGLDGPGFRQAQRRDERLAEIPVVVCSASLESRDLYRLEAKAILSKPIEVRELIATVRRYC